MATRTFTEGATDNTQVFNPVIVEQNKRSLDVLEFEVLPAATVSIGDTVNYQDTSSTTIFSGIVTKIETASLKKIFVSDHGIELQKLLVNQIYTSQSPEAIISTVVGLTGLTYTSTISSGITIEKYVAKDKRAWDIVTELAEFLEADFRVDKNSNFHLELTGEDDSSQTITNTNASLQERWKEDASQLANNVIIQGDRQVFEKTESFAGPTTSVTLSEIPIDVYVTVGGTEKEGFIDSFNTGDYKVDRENKTVTFNSSSSTIEIRYTYNVNIKVTAENSASISTYGQYDKKFEKSYITSYQEARKFARFILGKFGEPILSSTWIINDQSLFESFVINEKINVNDDIRSINQDFIIIKKERTLNELFVTVGEDVDDLFDRDKELEIRLKQLEAKDDNATTLQLYDIAEQGLTVTLSLDITRYQYRGTESNTAYYDTSFYDANDAFYGELPDDDTGVEGEEWHDIT